MNKRLILVLTVTIIVLTVAVALIANLLDQVPAVPEENSRLNNVGYLDATKLFVVSANSSYGTHNGQACFIINVTVRNDYTAQQPPPMDHWLGNSTGEVFFGLTATLYDKNGQVQVKAKNIDQLVPQGVPELGLNSGETASFEINMATSSRSINGYSVDLVEIAGYPIP